MNDVRRTSWLALIAIVGLALNLRPALAALGPLLDSIQAAVGLSHTQASLLTTLPIFVMGLGALAGRYVTQWVTERNGIALGAVLVALACAARLFATTAPGLLLTAILAGVGIALVQTLVPACIKRGFGDQAGRVFALYTTGIMAGAAVAAAAAAGLAAWAGWPVALAIWALPALLALPLWRAACRARPELAPVRASAAPRPVPRRFMRNARAWALMLFFGIGTGAYTLVLAWLPPYYTSLGWQPSAAGFLLSGLTVTEVISGLAVSAWIGRFPDRRGPLMWVLVALIAGLTCLAVAPLSLALVACVLVGIGIGALFPLSLIVALDHVDDPSQAGMLAAFVQGGGYLIASLMPLLAGVLRDRFEDLTQAWVVMIVGAVILLALCSRFSPASYHRIDA
ncbi:MFS transporter [Verticiella alkaliphila]|uniref:MFS transporter n=1 Tax=Verticiella alkaliphila TaxID=2779529 RepID=UPI001C0B1BEF|nr:MFS transporter [Verticiella sp. GG226]